MIAERGQGNPLPPGFPYRGQWLIENAIFLYMLPAQPSAMARMSAVEIAPNGETCIGFDAAQLAAEIGVSTYRIWRANRLNTLAFAGTREGTSREGLKAWVHTFVFEGEPYILFTRPPNATGRA